MQRRRFDATVGDDVGPVNFDENLGCSVHRDIVVPVDVEIRDERNEVRVGENVVASGGAVFVVVCLAGWCVNGLVPYVGVVSDVHPPFGYHALENRNVSHRGVEVTNEVVGIGGSSWSSQQAA